MATPSKLTMISSTSTSSYSIRCGKIRMPSLGTASNVIPQTLYLKHELLAKFRFFKWMYQNEHIKCKHFEELEIPSKDNQCPARFCRNFRIIFILPITFGDSMVFLHLINDIQYFSDIHPHFRRNEAKSERRIADTLQMSWKGLL